jgi:hypothetical protein
MNIIGKEEMKMEEDRLTIAVIIPNEEVLNVEDFL